MLLKGTVLVLRLRYEWMVREMLVRFQNCLDALVQRRLATITKFLVRFWGTSCLLTTLIDSGIFLILLIKSIDRWVWWGFSKVENDICLINSGNSWSPSLPFLHIGHWVRSNIDASLELIWRIFYLSRWSRIRFIEKRQMLHRWSVWVLSHTICFHRRLLAVIELPVSYSLSYGHHQCKVSGIKRSPSWSLNNGAFPNLLSQTLIKLSSIKVRSLSN